MTAIVLKYIGYEPYLRKEFEYGVGRIKKRDHENLNGLEKYYGFSQIKDGVRTSHIDFVDFIRVKGGDEWRRASDPKKVTEHLRWLFITNPIVYIGTTLYRVFELAKTIIEVFSDTFCAVYPQKNTETLAKVFIKEGGDCWHKKKEALYALWSNVVRDFKCGMIMQLAAFHALLNSEDATQMQILFTDKEKEWNDNLAFKETSSYKARLVQEAWFKTKSPPYLWLLFIHCISPDDAFVSAEVQRLNPEITENPIEWLENSAACTQGGLIRPEEIKILNKILEEDYYKKMSPKERYHSEALKWRFIWAALDLFERKGFVQYHCAYPFSSEKQQRIEMINETVKSTLEGARKAFRDLCQTPSSPEK